MLSGLDHLRVWSIIITKETLAEDRRLYKNCFDYERKSGVEYQTNQNEF